MVIGYGRIGSLLAQRLRGMQAARVIVAARREFSRVQARLHGCEAVDLASMRDALAEQDVVFSTPPQCVLGEEALCRVRRDAVVVDLASPPYGVDLQAATRLGISAWRESGVPGRYCPREAAQFLYDALLRAVGEKQQKEGL